LLLKWMVPQVSKTGSHPSLGNPIATGLEKQEKTSLDKGFRNSCNSKPCT